MTDKPQTREKSQPSENSQSEKSQADVAEKAMKLKSKADEGPSHPAPPPPDGRRDPDAGMNPIPREGYPVGGAFGAEGEKPVLERSRKVR